MRTSSRRLLIVLSASAMVSCSGKAEKLHAEQVRIEAQKTVIQQQIQQYENNFRSLGALGLGSVAPMQRQAVDMLKKAETAEAAADGKMSLWAGLEKDVLELRQKADAWKAKYVR